MVELSAERKAAQEAQREREEGLAHASQARLACLQAIAAGRVPKAELLDQLAWALIENTEWSVAEQVACRILGIELAGETGDGEETEPSLVAAAEAGPDQAGRVALALSLGIAEARIADRYRPEWERVSRHFAFLEAHGYTVSDVERKELEVAERRRAEYEADQAELAEEQGGGPRPVHGRVGASSVERRGGGDRVGRKEGQGWRNARPASTPSCTQQRGIGVGAGSGTTMQARRTEEEQTNGRGIGGETG